MFLFNTFILVDLLAQQMPLVYEVEKTVSNYPKPLLLSITQLPTIQALPNPFEWADGRGRILSINDWKYRRAEIGAQIQNYEIGEKPDRPDTITASYSDGILTVNVTKNGKTLVLTSQVVLPTVTGPFSAVIGLGGFSGSGSLPSDIFSNRNIAQITFNHNQVTTYGSPQSTNPYYQLYPSFTPDNTGQYSAWAWGVSRIIDGLELVQNVLPIDLKHIAVTGCSYAGKMALFAGAFDERIALTIAQESGGGGATSWRFSHSEPAGTVEKIDNTDYNWFMNSMNQFAGDKVWKLPIDHHELMAMCAPRALLVTANPGQIWLSNPSCYVASKACQPVYNALGIADRFGFSLIGDHPHCSIPSSQLPEIEAFVEKFLLGNNTANTNITTTPYNTNLSSWITWTTPTLSNQPSSASWASLVYPSNLQTGLDKNITLRWNKVTGAGKYLIQLSTDVAFKNIVKSDSTTTDTVKAITGLSDGKRYYWRVQVKNTTGTSGPWSEVWNFITYISQTTMPELVSAAPTQNRQGYITFRWKKANYASQYILQLSHVQSFASIFMADSTTSDTVKTLGTFYEGRKDYWRVKAKNVAGSSPWNESSFTLLYAPTDLVLQRSATKEITLSWKDNASSENGYVIERTESPQTSFTILDTLKGSGNEYADKKVEQAQTYTYRIKAYNDFGESEYSNEASLFLVGVEEEGGIPMEYSMSQNYPNPFNPTTKFKFALPQRSLTKLTIYDLLGREVQTMLNKELEAGYHEINFDASNFPSGVYYYRIQSGDFVQTKKMILIK
jgi:hypothetical protein